MTKGLAIVLLSGGMDSSLCAAIARDDGYELACLHVNYGQRTQERELRAFHDVCNHYDVKHRLVVDISHLAMIGGSSLTDSSIDVTKADLTSHTVPSSYVPFRNANILAIATSWAEVIKAQAVFVGAVQDDSSGYPDCREEFFDAFQQVIDTGSNAGSAIRIVTPILHMTKAQIVSKGCELAVPFALTWSCYQNSDNACGVCDSCALRLRGFSQAGAVDPLSYDVRPDYL